jgi:hypothetical protein
MFNATPDDVRMNRLFGEPDDFYAARRQLPQTVLKLAFLAIAAALLTRTMFGVDLGDEAYYVAFSAQWLKTGIDNSPFLTIHQTAALLPYVACRLYVALTGSSDGLVLFLRLLFVALSITTALTWWNFVYRITHPVLAGLSSIFVLSFVPFGLPSPSYNTLGMQALTVALACLGCALTTRSRHASLRWQLASAIAWSAGIVAYPTLASVVVVLVVALVIGGDGLFPRGRYYAAMVAICVMAGLALAVNILSVDKVISSVQYLNEINNVSGIAEKFEKTADLFIANPISAVFFAVCALLGILRGYLKPIAFAPILSLVMLAALAFPAVLFVRSHDIILMLSLAGIGLVQNFKQMSSNGARAVAICYTISMSAAVVTSASATNGLYNFCIGGLPAAALTVACFAKDLDRHRTTEAAIAATAAILAIATALSTSLFFLYGEPYSAAPQLRERVRSGLYKGLIAQRADYDLLQHIRREVSPMVGDSSLAVFSVLRPGIALETHGSIAMLTIFPLQGQVSKAGLSFTHAYYSNPKNRPEFVLVFEDGALPINPMESDFNVWYQSLDTIETSIGKLTVFRQRRF